MEWVEEWQGVVWDRVCFGRSMARLSEKVLDLALVWVWGLLKGAERLRSRLNLSRRMCRFLPLYR